MDGSEYKRRRIVVEDEDDEEVLSNPDEYVDEQNDPDDEEGEDIMVNWRRFAQLFVIERSISCNISIFVLQ